MRNVLILLAAVIGLFLITSFVLHAIYGPSFPFLQGEDGWVPDDAGGWRAHGQPLGPPPDQPSVTVPLLLNYLPFFIPGALLALFTLTPLRKKLEARAVTKSDEPGSESDRSPSDAR